MNEILEGMKDRAGNHVAYSRDATVKECATDVLRLIEALEEYEKTMSKIKPAIEFYADGQNWVTSESVSFFDKVEHSDLEEKVTYCIAGYKARRAKTVIDNLKSKLEKILKGGQP